MKTRNKNYMGQRNSYELLADPQICKLIKTETILVKPRKDSQQFQLSFCFWWKAIPPEGSESETVDKANPF